MSGTPTHSKMVYLGIIGDMLEGRPLGAESSVHVWGIRGFPSLSCRGYYYSPEFKSGNEHWRLVLYPNWTDEMWNPAVGWLRIGVCRRGGGPPKTFLISVGIKGIRGMEMELQVKWKFSGYGDYFGKNFCTRSELMKNRPRLIPGGILVITCTVKEAPHVVGDVCSIPCSSTELAPIESQISSRRGGERVIKDFADLLAEGPDTDVSMYVGNVEFRVHGEVILLRCIPLMIDLKYSCNARAPHRMTIKGCEPDIFKDFLYFLYMGSLQSLTEKTVFGLYRVADKYLVHDLKQLCLEYIHDILSVQTFCDTMKLAMTHPESRLIRKAVDFATKNIQMIIMSEEWQNFICDCPRAAYEILISCFGSLT